MIVNAVTKTSYGHEIAELAAVYGNATNAEDNTFATATPSASLKLQISNKAAQGFLVPGKAYYIDITEVPVPQPIAEPEVAEAPKS